MEKIFQMLQSTDPEIVLLAVTSLKNTRFYKENMGKIVGGGLGTDVNLYEVVDYIERTKHRRSYSTICIKLYWNLVKDKYDTEGN